MAREKFPVLASVSVILIFVQWAINGASFFLDRYRVPVLTSAIAIIFLPKFALSFIPQVSGTSRVQWIQSHVVDWDADHYFEAGRLPVKKEDLPDPTKAVAECLVRYPERRRAVGSNYGHRRRHPGSGMDGAGVGETGIGVSQKICN